MRKKTSSKIIAGGSTIGVKLSRKAEQSSMAGLEFLSGIPGTTGGAIRMNAGAYGSEMSEILIKATAVNRRGRS